MNQCPKCHRYMRWYMTYCCGMSYSGWHCDNCGYDTLSNMQTYATTNTSGIEYRIDTSSVCEGDKE